jgi:hypothetical protein
MDRASLVSHLHEVSRIGDWLNPYIHVAPTARR